ncbi:hypothetical protein OZX74_03765 [Bifidobacterium sp. ESL0798]|uniref:hypothetical protein n=1 Tax=Bifidobacterium sp. ESL0798 TaxID=2983235 RepID=UPI0023F9D4F8|nr:hypothetical protein [Bifidobacterium sp. ESL0798]WEV74644.1 hypothetical protein OZX74_03765 [Bifidobacterium sp. ESL0798]
MDITKSAEENSQLNYAGPSNIKRVVNARKEQTQLRALLLKGRKSGKCGICGRHLPSRYLHAAHIKPREKASERERRDPNIAMLNCVLGCDEAFECGDIQIDQEGRISLSNPRDPFLQKAFGDLVDKIAPAFNEENKKYFAAKYELVHKSKITNTKKE